METTQKLLTSEERQDRFIKRWKEERVKVDLELETLKKTDKYKNAIKELEKRNEERGTPIVNL
ncbi:MAG: hypothetical protein EAZ14_04400 [Runella slithyformis]|jgi:hypothetical protein|nr:MAG: hypothetical protein EAZ80_07285 [Runella slithyformis]TAF31938.1 MAG: hypothetical protein EAZ67_11160 [Cytophagales bacterium]TAF95481.1 MAG: hypothetical protein EAZ46_07530 [Runella sp.]TAG40502.1 MAG: hypothetical protein EAZ32_06425 [Cytophagia bacterium]TAF80460.1 MAG: hypothetical protein EAZ50_08665 [Runella slithyformis]